MVLAFGCEGAVMALFDILRFWIGSALAEIRYPGCRPRRVWGWW